MAVVATLGSLAWGQSLEELAQKEKARRKAAAASRKYTNDDLAKPSPSPSPTAEGTSSDRRTPPRTYMPSGPIGGGRADGIGANESPDSEGGPSVGDAGAETYWRDRAQTLRDTMEKTQQTIATLGARIAELQLDRDPNPSDQFDPNRLQKRETERLKAIEEVEKAKAALASQQQALSDLADEARRKGVPPGWLR